MEDLKQHLSKALIQRTNNTVLADFKKLTTFIGAAIAASFKLTGDERANFLVTNLLSMRDYMSSEIISEAVRLEMQSKISVAINDYLQPVKPEHEQEVIKKKEKSLEAQQHLQESTSVKDR